MFLRKKSHKLKIKTVIKGLLERRVKTQLVSAKKLSRKHKNQKNILRGKNSPKSSTSSLITLRQA